MQNRLRQECRRTHPVGVSDGHRGSNLVLSPSGNSGHGSCRFSHGSPTAAKRPRPLLSRLDSEVLAKPMCPLMHPFIDLGSDVPVTAITSREKTQFCLAAPGGFRLCQDRPCVPFSLPILRIFLSRLSSVNPTQHLRQVGRPSRRREVGLPQRRQRF